MGLGSSAILAVAILAFLFTLGGETRCANAQASCNVGDDEVFAGDLVLQSGTAFSLTQSHSITADRNPTWPDAGGVVVLDANAQAVSSKTITASAIDSSPVGASSASTGVFTTLNATGGGALTGTWTDLGSVTTADINGGTLDGVTIGGASAAAGTLTTLNTSGAVTVGGDTDLQNNDLNNVGDAGTDFTSSGASFGTDVTIDDALTIGGTDPKAVVIQRVQNTQGVTTTPAIEIFTSGVVHGVLVIVEGTPDGTDRWIDLVFLGNATASVISSFTVLGAPGNRIYTAVSGDLFLRMNSGASTDVTAFGLELQNPL